MAYKWSPGKTFVIFYFLIAAWKHHSSNTSAHREVCVSKQRLIEVTWVSLQCSKTFFDRSEWVISYLWYVQNEHSRIVWYIEKGEMTEVSTNILRNFLSIGAAWIHSRVFACPTANTQLLVCRPSSIVISFGRKNLIIHSPQLHALFGPDVEMGLRSDGTALSLIFSNRDVLVEGRGANDWRLIGSSGLVYCVIWAIDCKCSFRAAARTATTTKLTGTGVVLDDVILDKRILAPAVDLEGDSATRSFMCASVCYISIIS